MHAADRPEQRWILLPIMPALWLLAAHTAVAVSSTKLGVALRLLIAAIVAVPLFAICRTELHVYATGRAGSGQELDEGERARGLEAPHGWHEIPVPMTALRSIRMSHPFDAESRMREGRCRPRAEASGGGPWGSVREAMAKSLDPGMNFTRQSMDLRLQDLSFYPEAYFHYVVARAARQLSTLQRCPRRRRYPRSTTSTAIAQNDYQVGDHLSRRTVDWKMGNLGGRSPMYGDQESCGSPIILILEIVRAILIVYAAFWPCWVVVRPFWQPRRSRNACSARCRSRFNAPDSCSHPGAQRGRPSLQLPRFTRSRRVSCPSGSSSDRCNRGRSPIEPQSAPKQAVQQRLDQNVEEPPQDLCAGLDRSTSSRIVESMPVL